MCVLSPRATVLILIQKNRDQSCLTQADLTGLSDDEIRASLVIAALGHLNDAMISINQLYVTDSAYYGGTVSAPHIRAYL